jgi:hypothetical protein
MKVFLLLTLLLTQNLYASKEVGNGGDAVVCRNNQGDITKVELLDYYEARVMRGIIVNLGAPHLSVEEKVDLVLERLKIKAPNRFTYYKDLVSTFFDEAKFISDIHLVDISDSENVIFGKGCVVEQLAIQHEPTFPQDSRYLINKDLWDLMSPDHQAGLILHEIIYFDALNQETLPHENSKKVRYFNSYISSDLILNSTAKSFYETLVLSDLFAIELIQSQPVNLYQNTLQFDASGIIQELKTIHGLAYYIQGRSVVAEMGQAIEYYSNKKVKSISTRFAETFQVGKQKIRFSPYKRIYFYEDESLKSGEAGKETRLQSTSYELELLRHLEVKFYPTGLVSLIKEFVPQKDLKGKVLVKGQWLELCSNLIGDYFVFDKKGTYVQGCLEGSDAFTINKQKVFLDKILYNDPQFSGWIKGSQKISYLGFELWLRDQTPLTMSHDKITSVQITNKIYANGHFLTSEINFYDCDQCKSKISSAYLAEDANSVINGQTLTIGEGAKTFFDENGKVTSSAVRDPHTFTLHGHSFTFKGGIKLHENGMLKQVQLTTWDQSLKCANGKIAFFNFMGAIVNLDQYGFVCSDMPQCQ